MPSDAITYRLTQPSIVDNDRQDVMFVYIQTKVTPHVMLVQLTSVCRRSSTRNYKLRLSAELRDTAVSVTSNVLLSDVST